jgi:EAL domain-containing protein (putative c-di-GMP-specific phosphodiesterase class I)
MMPPVSANRLLVADANPASNDLIAAVGRRLGFAVVQAATAASVLAESARFAPTVLVLDPEGLGTTEIDLLSALGRQRGRAALILANQSADAMLASAEELGLAYGLHVSVALKKPLSDAALEAALAPQVVDGYRFSEQDLRRAIDRAQLVVHYQPTMRASADGWTLAGVEALLRWDHPDYGLVFPQEFIGPAERFGLIGALTDCVLQTGIDEISEWNRKGVRLELAVNLSPKLVTDAEFPERMSDFLAARGVAPEQLTLEITETAAIEDPRCTADILVRLRGKRIGLSLDDFGVGYSSLTQLYKLPFSEVKIDRTIGMELPQTGATRTIVRAMIELAHRLGLKVCCEGIENAAALEFLRQAGCDFAQGYHLARPMSAQGLAEWFRAGAGGTGGLRLAS